MSRLAWFRHAVAALVVLYSFGTPAAQALDPRTSISEYSLTNWPESAGPFPFGVYAIAQDNDGYLWLGTRTGLIRFDGTTFKLWQGAEPLPNDRISTLRATTDGALWLGFGTTGGVSRIRHGRVTTFDERAGLPSGAVNALIQTNDGQIWVGTFSGLARFADERFERLGPADGLPAESVLSVYHDRAGALWVGTSGGVFRRGPGDVQFTLASTLTVTNFAEDPTGTIWIVNPQRAFRPLDDAHPWASLSAALSGTPGRALLYDRSGSLWVATRGGGVLRVRDVTANDPASIERLTRREGLLTDEIRTLFEARDGTVWIGTRMGLSRVAESSVRAATLGTGEDVYVYAIASTADGSLWTATGAGLFRDARNERTRYGVSHGLPGETITALHEDPRGQLWVATTQGLARSTRDGFAALTLSESAMLANVRSITTDPAGGLWICDSIKGLFRWKAGKLERITESIHDGQPYVAYTDGSGRVWIGSWGGDLTAYHDDKVTRYASGEGVSGTVNVLYEDKRGHLWVGTSQGLIQQRGDRFINYVAHGFPQSTVVSIAEDGLGHLWFGTGSGLIRIAPDEFARADVDQDVQLRYQHYATEDGLPGTLGRPGIPSAARTGDGRLWFTTSVGVAVVDPARLRERPAPGPLKIDALTADGQRLEPQPDLRLPPQTSRIEIDYSILNLAAAPRLRSRYRLDGFESDWQNAGESRQASYTNLAPGRYTFRVAFTNSDGSWSDAGAELPFSVAPMFYQTRAFFGAVVVIALAGLWGGWQLRLRHVRRQYDLVLAERARVAREIHDTLLQSLVGVALEFDDISTQVEPGSSLNRQVGRIREQVEHYIRETRQSIWDLRSPTLAAADLSSALRDFGQGAVTGTNVRFQFTSEGTVRRLEASVEEQLYRIGQEAITNAVRHASATVVRTEIVYEPDAVRLKVSDDGRGFDPERLVEVQAGHWGVTHMRERAHQAGGKVDIHSSHSAGTSVEVVVPYSS